MGKRETDNRAHDQHSIQVAGKRARPFGETALIVAAIWVVALGMYAFLDNASLLLVAAGAASALVILDALFPERSRRATDFCFRYRWLLALALCALGIFLRLSGSSIGAFDEVFPTQTTPQETTLFGAPRWIRSDEFGVATPTFFSQAFNHHGFYSQQMSLTPTNMALDYYSPVWDVAAIGKPFAWGYLLFGNEIGLSWYWCSLVTLLFMTALEACLILTRGKRAVSVLGAVMITLSPAAQWWMLPHITIVFVYAMALFSVGYALFTAKTPLSKWASAVGCIIAATGFVLSLFPSLQVPCGYVVVLLLLVCLVRDGQAIDFSRKDLPRLAITMLMTFAVIGCFLAISKDDIAALLSTVYPGSRRIAGSGQGISDLFTNVSSLFIPYKDITYSNNCEVSTFIHFAPFFVLLSPLIFSHLKRHHDANLGVGVALLAVLLVEATFMVVGFPQPLADITLFRFCNRMDIAYGWTATLYTIWGFSALLRYPDMLRAWQKAVFPLVYAVLCFLAINTDTWGYLNEIIVRGFQVGTTLGVLALLAFALLLAFAATRRTRLLCAGVTLMMVFAGAAVNPIEHGAGAITNHPTSTTISAIAKAEPQSRWLCCDCVFIIANWCMANGAHVLDATNYYYDQERWSLLDPQHAFYEQSNRYANQCATLTDSSMSVELLGQDYIRMHLNPKNLKDLNIRYLVSTVDYTDFLLGYSIACERVGGQDGYDIYRLDYTTAKAE